MWLQIHLVLQSPAIEPSHAPDRRVAQRQTVRAINEVIEPIVAAHADQWFYGLDLTLED